MNIEFYPSSREVELSVPMPKPALKYLPKWYKDVPKITNSNIYKNFSNVNEDISPSAIKACVPFLDALQFGYIQETWQDVAFTFNRETGEVNFRYLIEEIPIVDVRDKVNVKIDESAFYPLEFAWKVPWIPKVPSGWSVFITSPINNYELPFTNVSGIIDADDFYHIPMGNLPFYLKYGFSGIIPAGTPMFQIIPVKRENWKSYAKKWNADEQFKRVAWHKRKMHESYKKFFHKKRFIDRFYYYIYL